MSLSDTATPAAGTPARQPSPSADTQAHIGEAGATPRRNAAMWKMIVGTVCTLLGVPHDKPLCRGLLVEPR